MFEQLRQRLYPEAKTKKEAPIIDHIRPEDVAGLNLSWNSHFNTPAFRQQVIDFPGLCWRVRGLGEYVVGDNWRHREDIGQIIETRAPRYRAELIQELLNEYIRRDYGAVVIGSDERGDNARFYAEAGFHEIERIVYYEKPDVSFTYNYRQHAKNPLIMPFQARLLEDLLKVDHEAFPWLWWNGRTELEYYLKQDGVTVYLTYLEEPSGLLSPVGYFGFTLYERWAHLDRLAITHDNQGQRLGAYQLAYAIELMANRGAKRVTLSTQETNYQSQKLYEGFGFRRVNTLEYSLVGKWLKPSASNLK
ncbi:MAG: GNAT family N-acetyltransferase [Chloroflexota bacterium]|nr:GNAT family N-acetyltransferase [Chloroflexota bacterium]